MRDLNSIKIICSDIDGTLLAWNGKDLAPTIRLIGELEKKGIEFVLCTGRGVHNLPEALDRMEGLKYVIGVNGAVVADWKTREPLHTAYLTRELGMALRDLLYANFREPLFCYIDGVHYLDTHFKLFEPPALASAREWVRTATKVDFAELLNADVHLEKLGLCTLDTSLQQQVIGLLEASPLAKDIVVTSSSSWDVEINRKGGSKGDACLWLCEQLGLRPDELLVAGDNANDVCMMEIAGIALAPANADSSAREAATLVVPSCESYGVERFLEQLL